MTHYYLYIMCDATLDDNSRFYKVSIGESEREQKHYLFLESYAMEHGHFFALWDWNAIEFLKKCLDSINGTLSQVIYIKGTEFVKQLKAGHPRPFSLDGNLQRHELMKRIDAAYYSMCMIRRHRE